MSDARDRSRKWVGELYDRHAAALYRYAVMILADPAAASDAVQQVFVGLMRGGRVSLESEARYLRRGVRNECFSMLRARRRTPLDSNPAILESVPGADDRPDERIAL